MRARKALFILLFLLVAVPTYAVCPDDPCVQCGYECTGYFGEFYLCDVVAAASTACVRCTPQNCGISTGDPCCGGGSGGF